MKSQYTAALITCHLLILAGAIVRATESGLGCPDWPKCFGQWIPPLSLSQLPPHYQTLFSIQGQASPAFSPFNTWVEYLNRLLGVVLGLQVTAIMVSALVKKHFRLIAIILFALVCLQGLLGALVVSSLLSPSIITLHMALAMAVLFILWEMFLRENFWTGCTPHPSQHRSWRRLLALACFQLILGTQSREQIDQHLHGEYLNDKAALPRTDWYESLEGIFHAHHIVAYALLILFAHHLWIHRHSVGKKIKFFTGINLAALFGSGLSFKYLGFPAWNQPLHLFLASLLICLFFAGLRLSSSRHESAPR